MVRHRPEKRCRQQKLASKKWLVTKLKIFGEPPKEPTQTEICINIGRGVTHWNAIGSTPADIIMQYLELRNSKLLHYSYMALIIWTNQSLLVYTRSMHFQD